MLVVTGLMNVQAQESFNLRLFESKMSREQTVTPGVGGLIENATVSVKFNKAFSKARVKMNIRGGTNVFAAHFHCGAAGTEGPVAVDILLNFDGQNTDANITNADISSDCDGINNLISLAYAMRLGLIYAAVHTTENPPNEVRGQMIEAEN